ncbi:hypothetical protein GGX14DRAFT_568347 [Mycena pura]|uniref:T6SS Phospholipase effector Tle1-like catalytic domain-containing protein n=1 Tax=Mycena pura TaxID=153505 RepID=A0AAD6V8X1_9AGAR|nr:hypothetical protein GGX14DRAFT_568347 [Mycena pura]
MSLPTGHAQEATAATLVDCALTSAPASLRSDSSGTAVVESPVPTATSAVFPTLATTTPQLVDQREARAPRVYVPPVNDCRCLILCFDGTGDQFDADNSNIVQLMSALRKDDRTKQMVYYQSGIGTYMSPKSATPFTTKISLTLDTAIAWNLDAHVMGGYEFLMQNYTATDRICIFGFSRGAYIARSLAGMIHKVGLLPMDQQVPFAYRMYTRTDSVGWAQSNAFKTAFSNDVQIDFIGVWDTVDSVGLIPRRLPFTTSNTIVRTFRHAVSLDEHRAKFKANLWNWPSDAEKKLGTHAAAPRAPSTPAPKHAYSLPARFPDFDFDFDFARRFRSATDPDENGEQARFESAFGGPSPQRKQRRTDVLEVWFAGCHCDVGGGSVANDTRHSLARIPLRWMVRECFKAKTGIMFDAARLLELGLEPATLHPDVRDRPPPLTLPDGTARIASCVKRPIWLKRVFSRKPKPAPADSCPVPPFTASPADAGQPAPGMEEEEDLHDALAPIYDQLSLSRLWWILEVLPFSFRTQRRDDTWQTHFRSNFGRARKIPHQWCACGEKDPAHTHDIDEAQKLATSTVKVHRTVQTRLAAQDAKGRRYVNRAHFHTEPEWVC